MLGSADDLPRILQEEVVDEVIFVLSRRQLEEFEESFLLCSELGIRARVALYFPHMKARVVLEELEGIPLLTFTNTPGAPFPIFLKRFSDLTVSAIGIVLTRPLLPVIALAVKLSSRGPVLYSQIRCGLNGRRFKLLKFRTMYEGADQRLDEVAHLNEVDGPGLQGAARPEGDPVGRVLRRLSLDELPQLYNVFRGDMSLVGPRPPIPDEVERYERWQRRRLSMKPGSPVSGRSRAAPASTTSTAGSPSTWPTSTSGPCGSTSRSCSRRYRPCSRLAAHPKEPSFLSFEIIPSSLSSIFQGAIYAPQEHCCDWAGNTQSWFLQL